MPLTFMQKLSESVFFSRPPSKSAQHPPSDQDPIAPKGILLLGWMDARDAHLAWYIQKYRDLYPQASIILVKARTKGLAFPSVGRQDTASTIASLRAILGDRGGSSSLYHLYDLYKPAILPLHVTIFDSTPGVWTWSFASNIFTAGLRPGLIKSLVATPLGYFIAVLSWLLIKFLGIVPDGQRTWAAAHNDPSRNREACRVYIYGDVDKMVASGTIEAHANDAIAKGFDVVKREIFEGTAHVAHARADPDRYWRVVVETYAAGVLV